MSATYRRRYMGLGVAIDPETWDLEVRRRPGSGQIALGGAALDRGYSDAVRSLVQRSIAAPDCGLEIVVHRRMESHVGLGAKTSLLCGFLVACEALGLLPRHWTELRHWTERGGASGIGINTAVAGGVVIDAGHPADLESGFAPSSERGGRQPPAVIGRWQPDWQFLTVRVRGERGMAGAVESDAFRRGAPVTAAETRQLASRVLYEIAPALSDGSLKEFCTALQVMQSIGFKRFEWSLQSDATRDVRRTALGAGAWCAALSSMGSTLLISGPDPEKLKKHLLAEYPDRLHIDLSTVNSTGVEVVEVEG